MIRFESHGNLIADISMLRIKSYHYSGGKIIPVRIQKVLKTLIELLALPDTLFSLKKFNKHLMQIVKSPLSSYCFTFFFYEIVAYINSEHNIMLANLGTKVI